MTGEGDSSGRRRISAKKTDRTSPVKEIQLSEWLYAKYSSLPALTWRKRNSVPAPRRSRIHATPSRIRRPFRGGKRRLNPRDALRLSRPPFCLSRLESKLRY